MNGLAIVKHSSLILILIMALLVVGCDDREVADSSDQEVSVAPAETEQARSNSAAIFKSSSVVDGGASQSSGEEQSEVKIPVYRGASDASAAVAVGEDMFAMADDEDNILRVYKIAGGEPVYS